MRYAKRHCRPSWRKPKTRRRRKRPKRSSRGFSEPSAQIPASEELDAAEDAVTEFDFVDAKVGDGLKLLADQNRWRSGRRHFGVTDFPAHQPVPHPALYRLVRLAFSDVNGVLPATPSAILVLGPEVQLILRLQRRLAANQRFPSAQAGFGLRQVKRKLPAHAIVVGDDERRLAFAEQLLPRLGDDRAGLLPGPHPP